MSIKPKLIVSFSGGKTSAYMSRLLKQAYADQYELLFIFANTGEEHENTLRFVDQCDKAFGLNLVWVEAETTLKRGVGVKARVVTFETASRSGEPFEQMIRKHGIPNRNFPHCTRELKKRPIEAFAKSIGWKDYQTAIGIRADEQKRISDAGMASGLVYPLAHWHPVDKQDINDWWTDQPFNLDLIERLGNCKWCWKKSDRKHFANIDDVPEIYDFPRRMEATYPHAGPSQTGEAKVFFRLRRSTDQMFAARLAAEGFRVLPEDEDADGGCSESCEAFGAEQLRLFDFTEISA
ncbi:phosphoadenosine phosphosulfate reductase family protein [Burkholderia ambifaria]|uniref:phosphoadenosine phosphosulfate reductase domain-containing protein n=1 Tax=Burkholderia ambifaria TaxID=152480 RepID=UPI0022A9CBC9|nr:phosphoadenosine phosphosulfate reductase family protein [Burkholderia ambifaria]WAS56237.1 phosphoadenosine phosphosulfate reductase family protein [Burkholderia ambifaria]